MQESRTPEGGASESLQQIREILLGEEHRRNETKLAELRAGVSTEVAGLRDDLLGRLQGLLDNSSRAEGELALQREALAQHRESMLEEMRETRRIFEAKWEELSARVESRVSELQAGKLDRHELADLLRSMAETLGG